MSEAVAGRRRDTCTWANRHSRFGFVVGVAGVGFLSLLLAGCSQRSGVASGAATVASLHLHGTAYGGDQPVSGATIQLYAVGTTGDGSASTPLLTQVVTSDANGEFTLTGDYQCPSASTQVYLTATGGNPGLPNGMTNPQLALMAALGSCGSLGSTTTIFVNELTTVAAVWPLAPFMSSYSAIGSGSSDAAALAGAFATAAIFANTTNGTVPGLNVPTGTTVPVAQINTLADALASCTNSSGGVAGDGSACGILFSAATPPGGTAPVNVIGAGMGLANNPTLNSASIFGLVGGKSPFQPTLTSAPADLAVQLASTTGGLSFSASGLVYPAAYLNFPATQTLTITNNSLGGPITFGALTFVGAAAGDFSQVPSDTDLCSILAPGQSCTIPIQDAPTATGVRNATLMVPTDAANSPQSIALSGTGLAHSGSSVALSPSSLTFSLAGVPQPVTVTNSGMTPVVLGPITIEPDTEVSSHITIGTETNDCPPILAPQSICTVQVQATSISYMLGYLPTGGVGTLQVLDSGIPGVETVGFTEPATTVRFSSVPLNFGDWAVGVTSPASVTDFTNSGGGLGEGPYITGSITGPDASDFTVDFSGSGNHGTFALVKFKPSAVGPRTATLITNVGNIPLSGNGIPDGPSLTVGAASAVAMVGVSVPLNGAIQNNGSTFLTPVFTITGPDASDFVLGVGAVMPPQIAPAQGNSFTVTFTPSQVGARTATLTATDSTSGYSNSTPLIGYADPLAPSVTPNSLNFGNSEVGTQTAPQTMSISAPNGDPVSIIYGSGNSASTDFEISTGTCATQTPCQISVSFKPSQIGAETAYYSVEDLVSKESTPIAFSGAGGVRLVSLSSTSLNFAARDIGTTSISQTVTLTNNGDATLIISGMMFAGANVGDFPIEGNTCASGVASGGNCTLSISFDPTASGARSAVLQIMSNAASSPDKIQLMGTGN